jgi:zinc transporter, ZIP family
VRARGLRGRAFLNAISGGILVFLLFDILAHATDPVEEALTQAKGGDGGWGRFAGLGVVYVVGFGVGLLR